MSTTDSSLRSAVGRRTVRSVSKLLLAAGAIAFLLWIASLLPGMDRLVPMTSMSLATLLRVVVTVVIVGLLVDLAPGLAALTTLLLSGPRAVVEGVASAVHWLVILAGILVAHRGLEPAFVAMLDGGTWLYDLVFLVLALPPLAIVAARLYVSIDPTADLVADRLAGASPAGADSRDELDGSRTR